MSYGRQVGGKQQAASAAVAETVENLKQQSLFGGLEPVGLIDGEVFGFQRGRVQRHGFGIDVTRIRPLPRRLPRPRAQ